MNMQLMQVVYKASKTHKKPVDCNHIARLFYYISKYTSVFHWRYNILLFCYSKLFWFNLPSNYCSKTPSTSSHFSKSREFITKGNIYFSMIVWDVMIKIYLLNVNCCVFLQILPAVICVLFSVRMAEVVDLKFEAKLSFHKEFCWKICTIHICPKQSDPFLFKFLTHSCDDEDEKAATIKRLLWYVGQEETEGQSWTRMGR